MMWCAMTKKTPTFEEAISAANLWCNAWEKGELSDEVFADRVAELLESKDGARGFFVVSLAGDYPLLDRLPDALLIQLRAAGESVIDLVVKNLAMSSAMEIHHQSRLDTKQQESSERIKERCLDFLRSLDPTLVKIRLETLLSATKGNGDDVQFLESLGYDKRQKNAIAKSINSIPENKKKGPYGP